MYIKLERWQIISSCLHSTSTPAMSRYKTARCRYFDDRGKPIRPYCEQGDRCNFIHPNDRQWQQTSSPYPRKPWADRDGRRDSVGASSASDRRDPPRRPSVLAPQTEAFRRSSGDDNDHPRSASGPGEYRAQTSREAAYRQDSRSHPDDRYSHPPRAVETRGPSHSRASPPKLLHDEHTRSKHSDHFNANRSPVPIKRSEDLSARISHHRAPVADDKPPSDSKFAETITEMFRSIAKMLNRAVQDTAASDAHEEKLRTYNELSSALCQVSPSAAAAVNPILANIILNHAKYRERVQGDFKRLGHIWEDVLEIFVKAAVRAIDAELEAALSRLRRDINVQVTAALDKIPSLDAARTSLPKRKLDSDGMRDGRDDYGAGYMSRRRGSDDGSMHKRPRLQNLRRDSMMSETDAGRSRIYSSPASVDRNVGRAEPRSRSIVDATETEAFRRLMDDGTNELKPAVKEHTATLHSDSAASYSSDAEYVSAGSGLRY